MGPPENPTRHHEKQVARRRKRAAARPRSRWCLLKGCEQRFRPQHARQRYCSEGCRKEARKWSEWKARQAIPEAARVITKKFFLETAATGRAATSASCARGDRSGKDSARVRASARWNASGNASGAGDGDTIFLEGGLVRGCHESPEMSLPY